MSFLDRLLQDQEEAWADATHHVFLRQCKDGSLPHTAFVAWLVQVRVVYAAGQVPLRGRASWAARALADVGLKGVGRPQTGSRPSGGSWVTARSCQVPGGEVRFR